MSKISHLPHMGRWEKPSDIQYIEYPLFFRMIETCFCYVMAHFPTLIAYDICVLHALFTFAYT